MLNLTKYMVSNVEPLRRRLATPRNDERGIALITCTGMVNETKITLQLQYNVF